MRCIVTIFLYWTSHSLALQQYFFFHFRLSMVQLRLFSWDFHCFWDQERVLLWLIFCEYKWIDLNTNDWNWNNVCQMKTRIWTWRLALKKGGLWTFFLKRTLIKFIYERGASFKGDNTFLKLELKNTQKRQLLLPNFLSVSFFFFFFHFERNFAICQIRECWFQIW